MTEPELLKFIQKQAGEDREAILDEARQEAEERVESAHLDAERKRAEARERIRSESDRLRERRFNSVRYAMNVRRYEVKAAAIDAVWHDAERAIEALVKSDKWPDILALLFSEHADTVPEGSTIKANPSDCTRVEELIAASGKNLRVVETPDVRGGVEFHWPDNRIVLINTLGHRLAKLKTGGGDDIVGALFDGSEDAR